MQVFSRCWQVCCQYAGWNECQVLSYGCGCNPLCNHDVSIWCAVILMNRLDEVIWPVTSSTPTPPHTYPHRTQDIFTDDFFLNDFGVRWDIACVSAWKVRAMQSGHWWIIRCSQSEFVIHCTSALFRIAKNTEASYWEGNAAKIVLICQ